MAKGKDTWDNFYKVYQSENGENKSPFYSFQIENTLYSFGSLEMMMILEGMYRARNQGNLAYVESSKDTGEHIDKKLTALAEQYGWNKN